MTEEEEEISLQIEPGEVYSWESFKQEKPAYSIALDGFVDAPTRRDPTGPYANFDHHTGCDRIATRSTAQQIRMEINMGLFETFSEERTPKAHVYVNNPDEDVCLAWWLLNNHEQVQDHPESRLNRLAYSVDKLDTTAGAYPIGDTKIRRQMTWIFEPYYQERFKANLVDLQETGMRDILRNVGKRISKHLRNDGDETAIEGSYEVLGGGTDWVLTRETTPASRMAMYKDGIEAYAALVAKNDDGSSYVYTLGRSTVWIPFDLNKIYARLNEVEDGLVDNHNKWGGSRIVGGSPRRTGSQLKPHELETIIGETLHDQ